jgi:hypothetical protein
VVYLLAPDTSTARSSIRHLHYNRVSAKRVHHKTASRSASMG